MSGLNAPALRPAGLRSPTAATRRALASAVVVASAAAGAAPACAESCEAPTCVVSTTARPFATARVPDYAPAFRAAKPRRRRGGPRALAGGGDGGSWGGSNGGFGGDNGDSRWWGEPQQPEGGGDAMLWHTLSALSLLAGVQHVATRALVRCLPRKLTLPLSTFRAPELTAPAAPAQAKCEQQGIAAC